MNLTVGRTTFNRNNWPGLGALLAGLTTVGVLAGIGIWQATESDSRTIVSPPAVALPADLPSAPFTPTYVYLVETQAQADAIYQADFEARMSFGESGAFNHNFRVINLSTPEGQEEYRLMNAELNQVSMEDPAADLSWLRVIDMTAPATGGGQSTSTARPVAPEAAAPATPTYFYLVESQEQADRVLQAEVISQQGMMIAGFDAPYHHTVIIDISTQEGVELLNTVNASLFEVWDTPGFDPSLIQVIDARN
jgi:hypothetical protein